MGSSGAKAGLFWCCLTGEEMMSVPSPTQWRLVEKKRQTLSNSTLSAVSRVARRLRASFDTQLRSRRCRSKLRSWRERQLGSGGSANGERNCQKKEESKTLGIKKRRNSSSIGRLQLPPFLPAAPAPAPIFTHLPASAYAANIPDALQLWERRSALGAEQHARGSKARRREQVLEQNRERE